MNGRNNLEERIIDLESRLQRYYIVLITIAFITCSAIAMSFSASNLPVDVIRANRFELVDSSGTVIAQLRRSKALDSIGICGIMESFNLKGSKIWKLGNQRGFWGGNRFWGGNKGGNLTLFDDGKRRSEFATHHIELVNDKGEYKFKVDGQNRSVGMRDNDGATTFFNTNGFCLKNSSGNLIVTIGKGTSTNGGFISLRGSNGNRIAYLGESIKDRNSLFELYSRHEKLLYQAGVTGSFTSDYGYLSLNSTNGIQKYFRPK